MSIYLFYGVIFVALVFLVILGIRDLISRTLEVNTMRYTWEEFEVYETSNILGE